MGVTNILTERQPTTIMIEIESHAELEAFVTLVQEGLWAMDRHDDVVREVIGTMCERAELPQASWETVGKAFYDYIDALRRRFADGTPSKEFRGLKELSGRLELGQ